MQTTEWWLPEDKGGDKGGLFAAEKALQWGLELMGASAFDRFKVQAGSRIMEFGP